MRYLGYLHCDTEQDDKRLPNQFLGLFETEEAAVAAVRARLAQMPPDELDDDGEAVLSWWGLVDRGEFGHLDPLNLDEHGNPTLRRTFPELPWDHDREDISFHVDHEYQKTQPFLQR